MAPEVLSGQAVSTAADIYGLGLVLWEMTSAEKPFEGLSVSEVKLIDTCVFNDAFLSAYLSHR